MVDRYDLWLFSWLGDGIPELARRSRSTTSFLDQAESPVPAAAPARMGSLPDCMPDGAGLVHCYSNDACREAIASNVAADSDISSIREVREAKETGDEEREIGWFGSRSLDVRR